MKALILVDLQNDFLPGGSLEVADGDWIIPVINARMSAYSLVAATQDWHPGNHVSFASNHPDKQPFDRIDLPGGEQILWPDHCVQQTGGALFAPGLDSRYITRVFPKGADPRVDSYSGFYDNDHQTSTGLAEWLRERGVEAVDIAGLATDVCVLYTVLDALKEGFQVGVLADACRGVDMQKGDCERAFKTMEDAGADILKP